MKSEEHCVHCGYPESRHAADTRRCPGSSPKTFATMALPEGYTCKDCYAFRPFCLPVIGKGTDDTTCDYFPVRFVPIRERKPV